MPERSSKRPTDVNQRAKLIVDIASGEVEDRPGKSPAAVALGRLGGKKGGKVRAANLSTEERRGIAKKAAAARWGRRVDD